MVEVGANFDISTMVADPYWSDVGGEAASQMVVVVVVVVVMVVVMVVVVVVVFPLHPAEYV
jgi:hypothetical protein